jgi:hypothetical protein
MSHRSLLLPALCLLSTISVADCTAPNNPGVRICAPTPNSTVVYVPTIDFNSTPAFGADIIKYDVYDNDQKIVQGAPGQTGDTLRNFQFFNGVNRLVINAWDTQGNLYQAKETFHVIGDGFPTPCAQPASPGINFCAPTPGAVLSVDPSVSATARGLSKITVIRLYVDGKSPVERENSDELTASAPMATQGDHTVAFVAWDAGGHVFKSTRVLHATYTYGFQDCLVPSQPCGPGFDAASTPASNDYVGKSFTIMADIQMNPHPITTMKAYLDGKLVATSHGPTMIAPVENAPDGTHILTLQGWDTQGVLYRIQNNININVPH